MIALGHFERAFLGGSWAIALGLFEHCIFEPNYGF
jgi:hypothetical protein